LWDEDLSACSLTLPKWGSMRDGVLSELLMLEHRTAENDAGLWPTPTVCGNYNRKGASAQSGDGLATAVKTWPTPTVNDSKNCTLPPSQVKHDNIPGALLRDGEKAGGALNPTWVEWLMGWPLGWTDLKPLATGKFRNVPPKHGVF
jgi:DNA (cytosine-5)-methyltransferase 1